MNPPSPFGERGVKEIKKKLKKLVNKTGVSYIYHRTRRK
jgi:hypothetical protein